VRRTGGLADMIFDADYSGRGLARSNGFVFNEPDYQGLDSALHRVIRYWFDHPDTFAKIARNGMRFDCSWKNPAKNYESIYDFVKA
ncbi:MAG: hypothetical protein IH831_11575, partial [Planctomycetes bacterium]|nr:hypothetical protein [Planctomycetota bacterium]